MAKTYYLGSTNSDLTGGADFSKYLEDSAASGTLSFTIAKAATETQYAFTRSGSPGLSEFPTGSIEVKVNVTTASADVYLSVNVHRINSAGTIQESAGATAEQQLSATGVYTFTTASKDWAAGNATDRIRVDFICRNSETNATRTIAFGTDSSSTVVAPFSSNYTKALTDAVAVAGAITRAAALKKALAGAVATAAS